MKFLIILVCLFIVAMSSELLWLDSIIDHSDNSYIITTYLDNDCTLANNKNGSQYWYECNKVNYNPGTNN